MKILLASILVLGLAASAAMFWQSEPVLTQLSSVNDCTPANLNSTHAGMVWVPGGAFTMGAEIAYREEGPAFQTSVVGFWMDQTEVTNAQYAEFVAATAYRTLAERGILNPADPSAAARPGSAVFSAVIDDGDFNPLNSWWNFVDGANWREPEGPGSSIEGMEQYPVVHIAYEDAQAYANWKGRSLPTEQQFEFAAQSSSRKNAAGEYISNTWQGFFPFQNDPVDGYVGSAPVACYSANDYGIYDLIGNVWEWTSSPYFLGHDYAAKSEHPQGFDPEQPEETAVAVIKGGSFLCAPNYCMRYRPEARQGQSQGLGTSHIGFRTVLNEATTANATR